jgi:hypothetical protein
MNDVESDTLAALRDMLLPKLLSGEIRVGRGLDELDFVDGVDELDLGGAVERS